MKRVILFLLIVVTAVAGVTAQDWSKTPTYGTIELEAGFAPDPYSVDLTAGGSIDASPLGRGAAGYVSDAPDFDLDYQAGSFTLYIYVRSDSDTTLLVNGPDGTWYGNDDSMGNDPLIVFTTPSSGLYDIWVGTYGDSMTDATLYISEVDPRSSGSGSEPDYSLEPTYETVNLSAGFANDPYQVRLTAGGSIPVSSLCLSCYGNVAEAPDVDLYYESGSYTLYIYVRSKSDTTLLVNTPDGTWIGDDDSMGSDPLLIFTRPASGLYDIWVGTYGSDLADAVLYISEVDPR